MPYKANFDLLKFTKIQNSCATLRIIVFVLLAAMVMGCEPDTIKFTIVSLNGETHFAVPAEMMPKCCRPDSKKSKIVLVDLDPKKLGGNSYYSIKFYANGNDNVIIRKILPDRVSAAEEVPSDFANYKKYIEHKDVEGDFLLVGKDKSGNAIYLQCAKQINPYTKCAYFGIFDQKLVYEFNFPITQIGDIENLIIYAKTEIGKLILKE